MAARQVTPKLDAVAAAAVDLARSAAEEVAGPDLVGEHLGVAAEGERVVVHRFVTLHRGYVGWAWNVVLTRVPRARVATVSEVVLLPGDGALLPPPWLPWSDRVEPGDLGETDVLPFREVDPLLDEAYEVVDLSDVAGGDESFGEADVALAWELGLGRQRVVNRDGRIEAATRWYAGDSGPDSVVARAAAAPCATCGYLVGLTGSLRQLFGVCANAWSPDDGKVVSLDHGCGAHSETGPTATEPEPLPEPLVDDLRQELDTERVPSAPGSSVEPGPSPDELDAALPDSSEAGSVAAGVLVEPDVELVADPVVAPVAEAVEAADAAPAVAAVDPATEPETVGGADPATEPEPELPGPGALEPAEAAAVEESPDASAGPTDL